MDLPRGGRAYAQKCFIEFGRFLADQISNMDIRVTSEQSQKNFEHTPLVTVAVSDLNQESLGIDNLAQWNAVKQHRLFADQAMVQFKCYAPLEAMSSDLAFYIRTMLVEARADLMARGIFSISRVAAGVSTTVREGGEEDSLFVCTCSSPFYLMRETVQVQNESKPLLQAIYGGEDLNVSVEDRGDIIAEPDPHQKVFDAGFLPGRDQLFSFQVEGSQVYSHSPVSYYCNAYRLQLNAESEEKYISASVEVLGKEFNMELIRELSAHNVFTVSEIDPLPKKWNQNPFTITIAEAKYKGIEDPISLSIQYAP